MRPTLVLLVAGLTPRHLGAHMPRLAAFARAGTVRPLTTVTPAVTCTVQATFMTGTLPRDHGIVANGWLFRSLMEVWLWRQSNRLVTGEKIWEAGKRRDPSFTTANLFWWYNMAATHDIGVTPRPIYKADGRKLPDCYTQPWSCATTHARARAISAVPVLGAGDIDRGVALDCKCGIACPSHPLAHPDVGLPSASRLRPATVRPGRSADRKESSPRSMRSRAILIADAERDGARVVVLSEYGITRGLDPVHINRALREAGLLRVRLEDGGELLDIPQSHAFAVADHQIAHIYVAKPQLIAEVRRIVASLAWRRAGARSRRAARHRTGSSPLRRTCRPGTAGRLVYLLLLARRSLRARISRASSRSIASPATIRSSCSSTRRSAFPSWRSAGGSVCGRSIPYPDGHHSPRCHAGQRLARPPDGGKDAPRLISSV